MKYILPLLLLSTALLSSCVTKQKYQELEEQKKYYEKEATTADSLKNEYNKLAEEKRQLEIEVRNTRMELEEYLVTNKNLYRSYQDVLDRLDQTTAERNELDETVAYEKVNLQQQLGEQQESLQGNRQRLESLEYELYQKDNRLNVMEYDYSSMKGSLQEKNIRIQELEQMLNLKEGNMQTVRADLNDIVAEFSARDLSVEERGGKLYVSLSSALLFPSGSTQLNAEGRTAVRKLSQALKNNPDIDILVEGHTDSQGSAMTNWNLSVDRAVAVTNALTDSGVNPERITAAGRGEFMPIASNQSAQGRARNRRTEIVISPKLDEIYELLSR
jgi:chemotaxis protein MotB